MDDDLDLGSQFKDEIIPLALEFYMDVIEQEGEEEEGEDEEEEKEEKPQKKQKKQGKDKEECKQQ